MYRSQQELLTAIDETIKARSLLKHPFYQAWQRGQLSLEALRGYACQYVHFIRALPTFVSATHASCDDPAVRRRLLENLVEEEGGEDNLLELWLRFGEGLGLSREGILCSQPLPETEALVQTYRRISREGPVAAAFAALYAYEAQIPAVAATKLEGLRQFYSFYDEGAIHYFRRHGDLDIKHSSFAREMLATYRGSPEAQQVAFHAADEATKALWGFLDGVHRQYVAC